jgi:hypothetical protein
MSKDKTKLGRICITHIGFLLLVAGSLSSQSTQISIESVVDTELPKKVTLIEPIEFAIADGKGKITARAGTTVDLISRSGSTLRVKYLNLKKDIRFTQTSLLDDIAVERKRLTQRDAGASKPGSSLNRGGNYTAEQLIGMTRERMLSLMGQPITVTGSSNSIDGSFKIYSYSKENGRETYFTIWDDEGTIDNGMYDGSYFFKK